MDELDRAGDALRAAPIADPTPVDALRPRVRRRVQRRRAVVALSVVVALGAPGIAIAAATRSDNGSVGVHTVNTADTRPPVTTRPTIPPRPPLAAGARVNPDDIASMSFVDPQHGFANAVPFDHACCSIAATSDGGATWRAVGTSPIRSPEWGTVAFTSTRVGWVYDLDQRGLFVTRDGGKTWTDAHPAGGVHALEPIGSSVWALVGCSNRNACQHQLERSNDGGRIWESTRVAALPVGPTRLERLDLLNAFAWSAFGEGEHSGIVATVDGGNTWHAVKNPCGAILADVSAVDPSDLWVSCSWSGAATTPKQVFRSYDGGKTWTLVARVGTGSKTPPDIGRLPFGGEGADLTAISDRDAILTAHRGDVSVSTDGGRTWTKVISTEFFGEVTRLRGTNTVWVAATHSGPPDIWEATDGIHFHVIAKGTPY